MLARRSQTGSIVVIQTKVWPYTRPMWDMTAPYIPKERGASAVFVDFDRFDAMNTAIEEGGFCRKKLAISSRDIPLGGKGQRWIDVIEFGIGSEIEAHELVRQVVIGRHCVFCQPLATVIYALVAKKRMLEHTLATLFTGPGSLLSCLVISDVDGGLGIETAPVAMNYRFADDINFLAIDTTNMPRK